MSAGEPSGGDPAVAAPNPRAPRTPAQAALRAAGEVGAVLVVALLLALLIKTFLAQAFFIPSSSMEQTLLIGDRVIVSKLSPGLVDLHRGDVVVFSDPGQWLESEDLATEESGGVGGAVRGALSFVGLLPQSGGDHLIKRVVGLPGDHVVCCDAQNRITVNGVPIDETPYLDPGESAADSPCGSAFDVTVPSDHLWVLGDNRRVSADSRCHRSQDDGMVPVSKVVGTAVAVIWPLDRVGGLGVPSSVFGRVPAGR